LGIIGVIAGFVPSFFWMAGILLGTAGLIVGLSGYGRVQRDEATNGTMALWGIFTSAVALIVWIVAAAIFVAGIVDEELTADDPAENTVAPAATPVSPQAEETAPTGAEEVDYIDLEVGDCLAEIEDTEEIFSVETVPCSEPHGEEVIAAQTLPDEDLHGPDAIDAQAEELCYAKFEGFVGLPYEESVLALGIITMSEGGPHLGDRLVLCTIYDPAGEVSGSLRGVER
jgi:hypothetical protein